MSYAAESAMWIVVGACFFGGLIELIVVAFSATVAATGPATSPGKPEPVYEGPHEVTIEGTEGVGVSGRCSCRGWSQSFAYAGAVEQWARGHLMEATGGPYNPDGNVPTLKVTA